MKRTVIRSVLILFLLPGVAWSLGLGEIELKSALNQPFEARIELLAATADELDALKVNLADVDAFKRAGIDRLFLLSRLRFQVVREEAGADYIRISTTEPMREPFLNFLVEASWSTGRLFREYTVLLDPPLYDPNVRRRVLSTPPPVLDDADTGEAYVSPADAGPVAGTFSGSEYGPIVAGDTLWSIASQIRPDSSVSVQQMMLALLHTNPEAFINNNINGLKRGRILSVPTYDEITATSASDAFAEARLQNQDWQEVLGILAEDTPDRVDTVALDDSAGDAAPAASPYEALEDGATDTEVSASEQADPALRLVAANTDETDAVNGQQASASDDVSAEDLAIANEKLLSLTAENTELKDQLSEAEDIIQNLERLLELKDDDLARMQSDLSGAGEEADEEVAPAAEIEGELVGDALAEEETQDFVDEAGDEVVDSALDAAEEAVDEIITEEAAAPPAAEQPPAPAPAEKSMLAKIMDTLMDYLLFIVGGIGGVIALVAAGLFIKKKRAEAEEQDFQFDFSDYEAAAAPTTDELDDATAIAPSSAEDVETDTEAITDVPDLEIADEDAAAKTEAPAEDPLAEVNVFLAYEYFDQAEEFVRDAIANDPDNLDFHAKLLEVFYAAGDKKSYEEAAKVLHDKVSGAGSHWDMAVAMWQELSPNRALFAEPLDGEDDAGQADKGTSGGVVDLTSEDGAEAPVDMPMDFDIGGDSVPSAEEEAADDSLDMTAQPESAASDDDDVLDFTAAADLGDDDASEELTPVPDDDVLDLTASADADDALDLSIDEDAGDTLDMPTDEAEEDLLDATAQSSIDELNLEEDLLDVTAAGSVESYEQQQETASETAEADDDSLDFDIGGLSEDAPEAAEEEAVDTAALEVEEADAGDDDSLDFDIGGLSEDAPEAAEEEAVDTAALEVAQIDVDDGLDFDFSQAEEGAEADASLGLELDMDADGDAAGEIDMAEIDMDGTVQMSASDFSLDDEDEDMPPTVFVSSSANGEEQTEEEEITTKLDLAKAYVELGDEDSARSILDEVLADGNAEQQQQARDLLNQL